MNRNLALTAILVVAVAAAAWFLFSGSGAEGSAAGPATGTERAADPAAASGLAAGAAGDAESLTRSESRPAAHSDALAAAAADASSAEVLLTATDHLRRPVTQAWGSVREDAFASEPGGMRIVLPGMPGQEEAERTPGDANGRVALRVPAGEQLTLQVGGAGYQARELALQPLRPGERVELGALALQPGAAVAGKVFDPAGQPVAGARVSLRNAEGGRGGFAFGGRNADTDAAGAFRFEGVEPGAYLVEAEARGFAPARGEAAARVQAAAGAVPAEANLRLREGRALRGMVVNQDRRPIAGAEVFLRTPGRGGAFTFGLPGGTAGREPDAVTDAAGRFTLQGVEAGAGARVNARAAGYGMAWAAADAQASELLVILKPALRFAGQVLGPDGQAAAGVEVRLEPVEDEEGFSFLALFDEHTAVSGADGRFVMEGLDPGAWHVRAASGAASAQGLMTDLTQDVEDFIVRLEPTSALTMRVTRDGDGAPVFDALVSLEPAAEESDFGHGGVVGRDVRIRVGGSGAPQIDFGGESRRERTAADGTVSFPDLPVGRYQVRVQAAGHATHEEILVRERGPQQRAIRLVPGADLLVRVEDGGALPLPQVEVVATPNDPALEGQAQPQTRRTDAAGRAVFAGLAPGEWSVDYRAAELAGGFRFAALGGPSEAAVDKPSHTAQAAHLAPGARAEVVLRATGLAIPVALVTRRGQPLAGATVRLEQPASGPMPPMPGFGGERTDPAGRARLQPLEPGEYELVVQPGGGLPERREKVTLTSGEQEVRIDVRGGRVSGVVEADGRMPGNATARLEAAGAEGGGRGGRRGRFVAITATADGAGGGGEVTTFGGPASTSVPVDGSGRFAFEEVPPGEYVVRISAPGYAPWTSAKFALAQEQAHDVGTGRLTSGGIIKGFNRRVTPSDEPNVGPGAFLLLNDASGNNAGFAQTAADGSYEFRDLAPGTYVVLAPPDFNSEPIEVKAGQTVNFDVPKAQ